ncbi:MULTISPECIES: glutamate racemase [unclassified Clostridium]|uniref:glutamate racemase n=1 Tax=unclassified Clostridium TaxID=2614128 RepID=UPI001C8C4FF2|nr:MULTISPECIES: glutamate racemase [unclassified Clostridium]MBX9137378.1 glutamate racemase [Clostridium sp. K12(2020)]MBX9144189.1 glutamate racemase [Clostridium sp. K13]
MNKKDLPIGFLDSGVGGLSVLREAIKIMPNENYIYFGDSKNAPYGVKPTKEIRDLTFNVVDFLIEKGIKGLVVACNTATSAAVSELRRVYPDIPLVGIEPAIKPAVELNRSGKILIMATPMTIKQEKFNLLLNKYKEKAEIVPIPCAGLMEFIEDGVLSGEELEEYLEEKLSIYDKSEISSIVLGCTHYPFVKDVIAKIVGSNVIIMDGGEGTAREIKRRLREKNLLTDRIKKGNVDIYNSLDEKKVIDLSWKLIQQP